MTQFRMRTIFWMVVVAAIASLIGRISDHPIAATFVVSTSFAVAIAAVAAIWGIGHRARTCAAFTLCAGPFLMLLGPETGVVRQYLPIYEFVLTVQDYFAPLPPPPENTAELQGCTFTIAPPSPATAVGHCVLTLLFGIGGVVAAKWFEARRERNGRAEPSR
jgi:hypothetical protein